MENCISCKVELQQEISVYRPWTVDQGPVRKGAIPLMRNPWHFDEPIVKEYVRVAAVDLFHHLSFEPVACSDLSSCSGTLLWTAILFTHLSRSCVSLPSCLLLARPFVYLRPMAQVPLYILGGCFFVVQF